MGWFQKKNGTLIGGSMHHDQPETSVNLTNVTKADMGK